MAEANFSALLDRPSSEVERPKPLPAGTYTTVLQGMPVYGSSAKKQTPFVEFAHKIIEASDDVDLDELKEVLGAKALNEVVMKNTYYLTENSLWRLKDFLDHCEAGDDDMSLRERIEDTAGKTVGVYVKHEPSQDGQSIYARIDRTVPVE